MEATARTTLTDPMVRRTPQALVMEVRGELEKKIDEITLEAAASAMEGHYTRSKVTSFVLLRNRADQHCPLWKRSFL